MEDGAFKTSLVCIVRPLMCQGLEIPGGTLSEAKKQQMGKGHCEGVHYKMLTQLAACMPVNHVKTKLIFITWALSIQKRKIY